MATLRWVCLSDTHFGAENSVLSDVSMDTARVHADRESSVLTRLVECLRSVEESTAGSEKPHLVLNGDILEMALAQDNVAAMVFDRFIDLAFAKDPPLFDNTIYYLPGNHDHHMWETAREQQYACYVSDLGKHDEIKPPWHVTTLLPDARSAFPDAELMTALVQRRAGPQLTVKVVYPNFGIASADLARAVVFHHGHFVEPLYTLMSRVKEDLFPGQRRGCEIWDWEADNFAWIDFFWSTLGRSGDAGTDVGLVYDMLQDERALDRLSKNLATAASDNLPRILRPEVRLAAFELLKHVSGHIKSRERANPTVVLSPSADVGLTHYLAEPLRLQIGHERREIFDAEVSFIFGHTHKPFEEQRVVDGYSRPMCIYNTGGWVVDTIETAPLQGAAVVLIDDNCNVVSLRFYNQHDGADSYAVSLAPPVSDSPNELYSHLQKALDFSRPPWTVFSQEVAEAVTHRHRLLPTIIDRGMNLTVTAPARPQ